MAKRVPTNTTAEMQTEAGLLGFMIAAMSDGGAGAIEQQEARGQSELVNSEVLPADMGGDKPEAYEALGIKLGEPVEDDPVFRHATLPAGWKKVPTDHSMWSKVVDETGRERISIFYKAASYDRSAFMSLTP